MSKSIWDDNYDKGKRFKSTDGLYDDPKDYKGKSGKSYGDDDAFTHIRRKDCYEDHPILELGGGKLIGGNCYRHQKHEDVALYVALDGMHAHPTFDPTLTEQPVSVYYPIVNMGVPKVPEKFDLLVDTILATLAAGKTVHIGCIGGHGRTGLVITALVARLGIDPDPLNWVRTNYCKKAVESAAQENFLLVHFGVPVKGKVVDKLPWGF